MSELTFHVPGVAVPKGSRSTFRGRSVESSKRWPEWKERVQLHAIEARGKAAIQGRTKRFLDAITITVTFMLPKPQRPKHERHITRPDLDKLVRGINDALTGILWEDDSQVTVIMAVKRYVMEDETPGVLVRIADSK